MADFKDRPCNGRLLTQGAEARIWETNELGREAVLKQRFSKSYRLPELDRLLTSTRIRQEVRSLMRARKLGIPSPTLLRVDLEQGHMVLGRVPGVTLKEALRAGTMLSDEQKKDVLICLGSMIGKLHDGGVIHGDLTTSNVLYNSTTGEVCLIDFGLSQFSILSEDRAVDLYVLERSFTSAHAADGESMFEEFITAYRRSSQNWSSTFNKFAEVRMRGRKRSMIG